MINAACRDKPLTFIKGFEARIPSSVSEFKLLKTREFIKAVSDTLFNKINAAYHDMPWDFYPGEGGGGYMYYGRRGYAAQILQTHPLIISRVYTHTLYYN